MPNVAAFSCLPLRKCEILNDFRWNSYLDTLRVQTVL